MSDTIQIDVRLGVTIITLPSGHRELIFHDDPKAIQISVDPVQPVRQDHPEAEVPDKPWVPLARAVPMKNGAAVDMPGVEVFMNDLYTVHRQHLVVQMADDEQLKLVHLSIRRNDRHWARDWRHFQRIKNELVGPENEGMELYPAESRLVDTSNQFHCWVLEDPEERWPVGWDTGRLVFNSDMIDLGARQRPHPEGVEATVDESDVRELAVAYMKSQGIPIPKELS